MRKALLGVLLSIGVLLGNTVTVNAESYVEIGQYGRPGYLIQASEDIEEEQRLGDMELIAQLVEAEAGNQPFEGKVLVAEVVLNRVASEHYPDTVEGVIFQDYQFSVIKDGGFDRAAWRMQESDYKAVEVAMTEHKNKDVLYFSAGDYVKGCKPLFKVGDHYFGGRDD